MSSPYDPDDFSHTDLDGRSVPDVVAALGARAENLEWRNEIEGLTFNLGDRFVKWNPRSSGVDLELEWRRLEWLAQRHPCPQPLLWDEDDEAQWMVTNALPGGAAVGEQWRAQTDEAIRVIAEGLRVIHAVPVEDFPVEWVGESWAHRHRPSVGARPPIDEPVLVHGDACAPNTLINSAGEWVGHVDLGDLTVGDRWADLAIASMSLDWNFGEGHQEKLYHYYGIEPDAERIHYYRELWHLES